MTELFLNDTSVDLYGNSGISLNFGNAELDKFVRGGTKGTFSYDITIPATKKNKKEFYFPELILEESFDDAIEKTARLEVDGNVVLNGYARIKTVVINNDIAEYKLVLHEGNGSWISQLKDKSIRDIDYSDKDHTFSKNAQTVRELPDTRPNQLVTYPVINYGQNVKGANKWSVEDRYPAFMLRKVFKDIFLDAGYRIESAFLDSDFFTKLWFTCNERPKRKQTDLDPHKFKLGIDTIPYSTDQYFNVNVDTYPVFNLDTTPDLNGELTAFYNCVEGAVNTSLISSYVCQFNGRMSFIWNYSIKTLASVYKVAIGADSVRMKPESVLLKLNRTRDGVTTVIESRLIYTALASTAIGDAQVLGTFTSRSLNVKPNDVWFFSAKLFTSQPITYHVFSSNGNVFSNKVFDTLTDGSTIYIEDVLPDILQTDFIKDIRTMFNLYFYTDELAKTVYIEPRDEFYTGTALDWTAKLDKSKPIEISHLGGNLGKKVKFKYATDSADKFIKTREDASNNGEPWLSKEVSNSNKDAKDGTTIKQVDNFAPTFIHKGITTAKTARIPIIWDGLTRDIPESKPEKWVSRILYYKGRTTLPTGEFWKYEGVENTYYPEFTTNYIEGAGYIKHVNSLDFETNEWAYGLYDKHYHNSIETINDSRIVHAYLKLTSLDILNLDFRTPIYIENDGDGNYYHLEKIIDYTPESVGTFKCRLVRVINPSPLALLSTSPTGEVIPPFLKDEFEQDDISLEDVIEAHNVVMTQSVWMSTVDVPTGEFIDVEYGVIGQDLTPNDDIRPKKNDIIIEE